MHLLFCNKHVLIMITFLRIEKTSQQILCVSQKTYYEIENFSSCSYSHLGDPTLPISVEIQTKLFSSKNIVCFKTIYLLYEAPVHAWEVFNWRTGAFVDQLVEP